MGGGDLNLKKSWHPTTMRNMERVWKAEQKHEAEQKKIEELQKELAEERAREEIRHFAEEQGVLKKKSDRLDWMYEGPSALANREEYLLGRPVDKTFEMIQQLESGTSNKQEDDTLPESILKSSTGNVTVDLANKIREDPLLVIRKQEEDNKRKLLDNPIRMKQLQQMLRDVGTKSKPKKSKKRKKRKSKKHHQSDSEESSSEESGNHHSASNRRSSKREQQVDYKNRGFQRSYSTEKIKNKHHNPSDSSSYKTSREQRRHDTDSDSESVKRDQRRKNSFSDENPRYHINFRSKRNERRADHQEFKIQDHTDVSYKRRRSLSAESEDMVRRHSPVQTNRSQRQRFDAASNRKRPYVNHRDNSSDSEEKNKRQEEKTYDHSRPKRDTDVRRRHSSSECSDSKKHQSDTVSKSRPPLGHSTRNSSNPNINDKNAYSSRKLDATERERRLQEMTQNAVWREEQRKSKYNSYVEEAKKETQMQMQHAGTDFVTPLLNKMADTGSVAGRIKSNIYNIQRTKVDLNSNFAKR